QILVVAYSVLFIQDSAAAHLPLIRSCSSAAGGRSGPAARRSSRSPDPGHGKERSMKRWIIGAIAPLAVVAVAVTIPVFAQPKSNPAPLWSEHQVTQAVPAPPPSPWVQLARELKPAVVNVSTTRVEEGSRPVERA